jgi:queuine tRNA-ribosyltransferase accessory subunit
MDASNPDSMLRFSITNVSPCAIGPRIGQLLRGGRKAVETPHYVATTSRGVVPHISPDTLRKHTAVSSIHVALEDCKQFHLTPTSGADSLLTVPVQS